MKSYAFRLGTVLRVRRVESLLARQHLGTAARALAQAVVREQEATSAYEADIRPPSELSADAFVAARERNERLAKMMTEAAADHDAAGRRLEAERVRTVRAERRVAVLEKLDERRRQEWLATVQREEAAVLDDFATVRAAAGAMGVVRAD